MTSEPPRDFWLRWALRQSDIEYAAASFERELARQNISRSTFLSLITPPSSSSPPLPPPSSPPLPPPSSPPLLPLSPPPLSLSTPDQKMAEELERRIASLEALTSVPASSSDAGRSLKSEYKAMTKRKGNRTFQRSCLGVGRCQNVLCDHSLLRHSASSKAEQENAAILLTLLVRKCAQQGYPVSGAYAQKYLEASDNKVVLALMAVKKSLDAREAKLRATGRISWERENQLAASRLRYINSEETCNDEPRDERLYFLEDDDYQLKVASAEKWESPYGQLLLKKYGSKKAASAGMKMYLSFAKLRTRRAKYYNDIKSQGITADEIAVLMENWDKEHEKDPLQIASNKATQGASVKSLAPLEINALLYDNSEDGDDNTDESTRTDKGKGKQAYVESDNEEYTDEIYTDDDKQSDEEGEGTRWDTDEEYFVSGEDAFYHSSLQGTEDGNITIRDVDNILYDRIEVIDDQTYTFPGYGSFTGKALRQFIKLRREASRASNRECDQYGKYYNTGLCEEKDNKVRAKIMVPEKSGTSRELLDIYISQVIEDFKSESKSKSRGEGVITGHPNLDDLDWPLDDKIKLMENYITEYRSEIPQQLKIQIMLSLERLKTQREENLRADLNTGTQTKVLHFSSLTSDESMTAQPGPSGLQPSPRPGNVTWPQAESSKASTTQGNSTPSHKQTTTSTSSPDQGYEVYLKKRLELSIAVEYPGAEPTTRLIEVGRWRFADDNAVVSRNNTDVYTFDSLGDAGTKEAAQETALPTRDIAQGIAQESSQETVQNSTLNTSQNIKQSVSQYTVQTLVQEPVQEPAQEPAQETSYEDTTDYDINSTEDPTSKSNSKSIRKKAGSFMRKIGQPKQISDSLFRRLSRTKIDDKLKAAQGSSSTYNSIEVTEAGALDITTNKVCTQYTISQASLPARQYSNTEAGRYLINIESEQSIPESEQSIPEDEFEAADIGRTSVSDEQAEDEVVEEHSTQSAFIEDDAGSNDMIIEEDEQEQESDDELPEETKHTLQILNLSMDSATRQLYLNLLVAHTTLADGVFSPLGRNGWNPESVAAFQESTNSLLSQDTAARILSICGDNPSKAVAFFGSICLQLQQHFINTGTIVTSRLHYEQGIRQFVAFIWNRMDIICQGVESRLAVHLPPPPAQ